MQSIPRPLGTSGNMTDSINTARAYFLNDHAKYTVARPEHNGILFRNGSPILDRGTQINWYSRLSLTAVIGGGIAFGIASALSMGAVPIALATAGGLFLIGQGIRRGYLYYLSKSEAQELTPEVMKNISMSMPVIKSEENDYGSIGNAIAWLLPNPTRGSDLGDSVRKAIVKEAKRERRWIQIQTHRQKPEVGGLSKQLTQKVRSIGSEIALASPQAKLGLLVSFLAQHDTSVSQDIRGYATFQRSSIAQTNDNIVKIWNEYENIHNSLKNQGIIKAYK